MVKKKTEQAIGDLSSIGQRFDWLLKHHMSPDGDEYTYPELIEGLRLRGVEITGSGLSKIRSGDTKKPGWDVIDALASFFNVPLNFFSLTRTLEKEELDRYATAEAILVDGTEEIAMRAARLNPQARKAVLDLINNLDLMAGTHVSQNNRVSQAPTSEASDE